MADQEHLRIIKKGIQVWNQWRSENPEIKPDLSNASLIDSDLTQANLIGVDLIHADLSFAKLHYANLIEADMDEANLRNASLLNANLSRASITQANLIHTDLRRADCRDVDFKGSSLTDANITGINLYHADLRAADLTGAIIISAYLGGTELNESDFTNAQIGWANFGNTNLRGTIGLHSVIHLGPSTIGIDTIYRSQGEIPESFLRGAGVPDTFITYARFLIGQAVDFYSCFISYSSENHDFAERLDTDLRARGVRCWFPPKDIKIGDKFRQRIEESIRLHDKLLLILSESSIVSPWVEEEVEAALERERKESRLVLFPISIDDAVRNTERAWAASLRRTRHIGEFKEWKSYDAYQKAFGRLIGDLKTE